MKPWGGRRVGEECLVGWPCQTRDSGCPRLGLLPPTESSTNTRAPADNQANSGQESYWKP